MRKTKKHSKKLFLIFVPTVIFEFMLFFNVSQAFAAAYYVSPSGSGTGCSDAAPCTPVYAINTKASPGDTILLKDGIYTGANYMIVYPYDDWNQAAQKCNRVVQGGEPGNPITIKAENDGKAIIDGEGVRKPVVIPCRRYINLEGIRAQNSGGSVIGMPGSENINLKRVSGYNAKFGYNLNEVIFSISTNSKNILIEDCVAAGTGRKMITPIRDSNVTVRRCFTKWKDYLGPAGSPSSSIDPYGTSDSLFENNIMTMFPHNLLVEGFIIWTHDYSNPSSGNRIFGNVAYNLTSYGFAESSATHRTENTLFSNNVNIDSKNGFLQKGGANTKIDHLNIIGSDSLSYSTDVHSGYCQDCDFEIHGDIRDSIFYNNLKGISNSQKTITKMAVSNDLDGDHYPELSVAGECSSACGTSRTSLTSDYNNLYGIKEYNYNPVSLKGNNDRSIDPNFKVSKYGKGAYLMRPENLKGLGENDGDIGAEVLYQYENGVLTSKPLWPWPMENRIQDETSKIFGQCYSVTYESIPKYDNPLITCTGGLWKTLEGVYLETDNSADVNSDGSVNIQDIQACVNVILGVETNATIIQMAKAAAAPLDACDVLDLQAIVNEILK